MKRILCIVLAALLLCGCAGKSSLTSLAPQGCPTAPQTADLHEAGPLIADFGLALLRRTREDGKNTLLSPLSVLTALSMTACGAEGETRAQMEQVLGADRDALNGYLAAYQSHIQSHTNAHMANALWIREDPALQIREEFLQANRDYYGAEVFSGALHDSTRRQINAWIEENTGGLIKDMLDAIPQEAALYLVNALSFDAQWLEKYQPHQVRPGEFTTADGRVQPAEMMSSTEHHYLETENATGFIKYYEGRHYAFAVLLPREGTSVAALLQSLEGEDLRELLLNPQDILVHAQMPKFQTEYSVELSEDLTAMGMDLAFDREQADFSGMGSAGEGGRLYLGRVLHKTFLQTGELGTRAGAATIVEVPAEGAMEPQESRTVILDRPFVYMIIDCEWDQPLFIGVLEELA